MITPAAVPAAIIFRDKQRFFLPEDEHLRAAKESEILRRRRVSDLSELFSECRKLC